MVSRRATPKRSSSSVRTASLVAKPSAKRFDDDSLLRSVLAKPLLDLVRQDAEVEADLRQRLGERLEPGVTALVLDPDFPGGLDSARDVVRQLLNQLASGKRSPAFKRNGLGDVALVKLTEQLSERLIQRNKAAGTPLLYIWPRTWDVIIDVSLTFDDRGRPDSPKRAQYPHIVDPQASAKQTICSYISDALDEHRSKMLTQMVDELKTELSSQYVFARLGARALNAIIVQDHVRAVEQARQRVRSTDHAREAMLKDEDLILEARRHYAIHRIWPDFQLQSCIHRSVRTVKADAAQNSFSAFGEGITWAVIDSGIDARHPHFALHKNIDPDSEWHADFSESSVRQASSKNALIDDYGHGTHVAAIIAGQQTPTQPTPPMAGPYQTASRLRSVARQRAATTGELSDPGRIVPHFEDLTAIAGIAPKCKLVSFKVLDGVGMGKASNVISAIAQIQRINGNGRDIKIHGVNISLGHEFDPLWFACGHSPLCVEVNRLVKSGVVVVVAAGNTGYGQVTSDERITKTGLDMSINDPGNAELAITVGSTHREAPFRYGVSYFSSKGPTGDGRLKPDLVAPGERIVSAAVPGSYKLENYAGDFAYVELSGTSMAAPHVSGAVAAFLSIRNEFVGEPEKVKNIFLRSATDLGRERYFQGAGMVDLLRAIQSI